MNIDRLVNAFQFDDLFNITNFNNKQIFEKIANLLNKANISDFIYFHSSNIKHAILKTPNNSEYCKNENDDIIFIKFDPLIEYDLVNGNYPIHCEIYKNKQIVKLNITNNREIALFLNAY